MIGVPTTDKKKVIAADKGMDTLERVRKTKHSTLTDDTQPQKAARR